MSSRSVNLGISDESVVIGWPEIQSLMDKDGFSENCRLVNGERGIEEYGSSAYLVPNDWLKHPYGVSTDEIDCVYDDELEELGFL